VSNAVISKPNLTQREREKERKSEREKERKREREKERKREREKERKCCVLSNITLT
jgi:hypothetical protein